MKRDPRLHALSSDHHHALALARRALQVAEGRASTALGDMWEEIHEAFKNRLTPHFRIEEEILLPALKDAGKGELVERTLAEHAQIRNCVGQTTGGLASRLREFATLLRQHVRFEERVLFEVAQECLDSSTLDSIAEATRMR